MSVRRAAVPTPGPPSRVTLRDAGRVRMAYHPFGEDFFQSEKHLSALEKYVADSAAQPVVCCERTYHDVHVHAGLTGVGSLASAVPGQCQKVVAFKSLRLVRVCEAQPAQKKVNFRLKVGAMGAMHAGSD